MAKRTEDGYRYENKFEIFIRNYKNAPGFKSVVNLGCLSIFLLMFIIPGAILSRTGTNPSEDPNSVTTEEVVTYREIVESLKNTNYDYTVNVLNRSNKYIITANMTNEVISGYFESITNNVKFKYLNDKLYEVKLDDVIENEMLFNGLVTDFVIPSKLADILLGNKASKSLKNEYTVYEYSIKNNNKTYTILCNVSDSKIKTIDISESNIKYEIKF